MPTRVELVEAYAKAQGLWRDESTPEPVFTDTLELDLATVEPSLAGPRRPQDRVALVDVAPSLRGRDAEARRRPATPKPSARCRSPAANYELKDGAVVIAAITICTNTSNPSVMLAAGLVARNAVRARPQGEALGQDLAGARAARWSPTTTPPPGCSRISTRSASISWAMAAPPASAIPGRCPMPIAEAMDEGDLVVAAVLSGNRNFEGRISPQVRANYLASPPLVVAYALAGSDQHRSRHRAAGRGQRRQAGLSAGHLADQPGGAGHHRARRCHRTCSASATATSSRAPAEWQKVQVGERHDLRLGHGLDLYRAAALFREHAEGSRRRSATSSMARELAILGDSITTDHISPAGSIKKDGPAGAISPRASGAAGGFQLLRRAPRQSRGDDARHLRQYPHHATRWCRASKAA